MRRNSLGKKDQRQIQIRKRKKKFQQVIKWSCSERDEKVRAAEVKLDRNQYEKGWRGDDVWGRFREENEFFIFSKLFI